MSSLKFNTLANPNKMDCENSCWFLMHRQLEKKKKRKKDKKKKFFLTLPFPLTWVIFFPQRHSFSSNLTHGILCMAVSCGWAHAEQLSVSLTWLRPTSTMLRAKFSIPVNVSGSLSLREKHLQDAVKLEYFIFTSLNRCNHADYQLKISRRVKRNCLPKQSCPMRSLVF